MMPRRHRPVLISAALALLVSALTVIGGAVTPASGGVPLPSLEDCTTTGGVAPCLESVKINGVAIASPYSYIGWYDGSGGSKDIYFAAQKDGGSGGDLGFGALTDTWRVVVFVGNWSIPRVTHGKAQNVKVVRGHGGSGYTVTITGNPVTVSGQCDSSGSYCPEDWVTGLDPGFNNVQWDGYFDFYITDYGTWTDASQRADFFGMNYFNNIAHTELPPQIVTPSDPSLPPYLLVNTANRRFLEDRTTLVQGRAELRIPNRFLSGVYGVPDPASMTSSGIVVGGDGTATVSVTQETGGDAMVILIDNMHFPNVSGPEPAPGFTASQSSAAAKSSLRRLRYKLGDITPTRPKNVAAKRVTGQKARVSFDKSHRRGAPIRGYLVKCVIGSGGSFVTASDSGSPIVVTGLQPGHKYTCRVRAKSKAGPSRWSTAATLRAYP